MRDSGGARQRRWQFYLFAIFSSLAVMTSARDSIAAPTGSSDVSFYVSDQFKTVARKTFAQVTAEAIASACPADKPLCTPVLKRLAEAFNAALANDSVALRSALNEFFIESSVTAGFETIASGVLQPQLPTEWRAALGPLLRCVAGRLAGRSERASCMGSEEIRKFVQNVVPQRQTFGIGDTDVQAFELLVKAIVERRPLDAAVVLRVLAAVASSNQVDRPDLRVYFLAFSDWVKQGISDGLTAPTFEYIANVNGTSRERSMVMAVLGYGSGPADLQIFDPASDAEWKQALSDCKQPTAPLDRWISIRDSHVQAMRRSLLMGWPVDLSPLLALEAMSCQGNSPGARTVALRRGQVRYLRSALQVHDWTTQYGAVVLSGAALIDFVRTRDEKQLVRNLSAVIVLATARVALYAYNTDHFPNPSPTKPAFADVRDVLRSCEFQAMSRVLKVPVVRDGSSTDCVQLADGQRRTTVGAVDATLQATLQAIADRLRAVPKANDDQIRSMFQLDTFSRAVRAFAEGNDAAAERIILRLGVDALVQRVDAMVTSYLHVSPETCVSDAASRSIFSGLGAGCAAHLLIQGAYHPIADYYWEKGASSEDPSELAESVYKNLLEIPYLDTTPIILNVGLGANYIVGSPDVWTDHGYGALTLLDKFGLAFYKRTWQRTRFETGPFVGGFLDALVRTAAGDGKDQRYWLLGYTAGFPRLWGVDMGVELHVGAAMPFSLNEKSNYGFAVGGALVVPFNFVFEGGK